MVKERRIDSMILENKKKIKKMLDRQPAKYALTLSLSIESRQQRSTVGPHTCAT